MSDTKLTGKVKKIVGDKGFGFLTPSTGGKDLFFHRSACANRCFDDLEEGQEVTYEPEESEKGPRAVSVTPVGK